MIMPPLPKPGDKLVKYNNPNGNYEYVGYALGALREEEVIVYKNLDSNMLYILSVEEFIEDVSAKPNNKTGQKYRFVVGRSSL